MVVSVVQRRARRKCCAFFFSGENVWSGARTWSLLREGRHADDSEEFGVVAGVVELVLVRDTRVASDGLSAEEQGRGGRTQLGRGDGIGLEWRQADEAQSGRCWTPVSHVPADSAEARRRGPSERGRTLDEVRPPMRHAAEVTGVSVMGARTSFTTWRSPVALERYSSSTSLPAGP